MVAALDADDRDWPRNTVTPIQLALAYGAVATAGADAADAAQAAASGVHDVAAASRRVLSENTTHWGRCRWGWRHGEGCARRRLRIAGKTGTAQKYDAAVDAAAACTFLVRYAPAEG